MTVTHYLFLSKEQRYALIVPESEVEVIGIYTPVWINNGVHDSKFPEEIFAKYRIRHCPKYEEQTINIMEGGFFIRLSPNMPALLLDYQDGGTESIGITHSNFFNHKTKTVPIVHLLRIEDLKILEDTI